ncbi:MAG: hypothetical protein AB8G86_00450 [Saprospiraceae bacterium]
MEFEWEGNDEMDEASGSEWVELKSINEIEGHFSFHFMGEESTFRAIRKK